MVLIEMMPEASHIYKKATMKNAIRHVSRYTISYTITFLQTHQPVGFEEI